MAKQNKYSKGLECALIALSFFRHRHDRVPRYKNPSKRHADLTVSCRSNNVRIARKYIRRARAVGWRGSIVKAVTEQ